MPHFKISDTLMSFFSLRSGHDWSYFGVFRAHLDGNRRFYSIYSKLQENGMSIWPLEGLPGYTKMGNCPLPSDEKAGCFKARFMRNACCHDFRAVDPLMPLQSNHTSPQSLPWGQGATTPQCLRSESMHHHDLMTSQVDSWWENLISTSPTPVVHSVPPSMGSAPSSFRGGARIP